MDRLSDNFLIELFRFFLSSSSFVEIGVKHLQYQYLPSEPYKKLWKEISQIYQLDQITPTIGILSERFKEDSDVKKLLVDIKKTNIAEKKSLLVTQFESYLKNVRFVDLYKKVGDLYNNDSKEEAMGLLAKDSEEIVNFTLKDGYYTKVFEDFSKRQIKRKNTANSGELKVPFGIHPLDFYTFGGITLGTSALFLARSGQGKSTLLRWVGVNAARLGYRVVHFQCEGTEQEALDAYDAAWTSVDLRDIEFGDIPKSKENIIKRVNEDVISKGGEIYVVASESFDSMSLEDCNEHIESIEGAYGKVHVVIFDYLEIFSVKGRYGGDDGERRKRETIANKITNIATKFKVGTITATQANDIRPDKWDNPDYVMTRSDIAEFKGALKPFSYFITLNQTKDEYENGIMRLYNDKFRKYFSGQSYHIAQSMKNSRFYDSKKTLEYFWDEENNNPR